MPRPPTSTLFPYTTLFRSAAARRGAASAQRRAGNGGGGAHQCGYLRGRAARFEAGRGRRRHPERADIPGRSEEHTSELQSHVNLVCRLLLETKNNTIKKAD